jgi:hypothetical protein
MSLVVLAVIGCAPAVQERPLRSPTLDYRANTVTTADGKELGADERPPEDTLQAGLRGGIGIDKVRLGPGWVIEDGRLSYDSTEVVGGHVAQE